MLDVRHDLGDNDFARAVVAVCNIVGVVELCYLDHIPIDCPMKSH